MAGEAKKITKGSLSIIDQIGRLQVVLAIVGISVPAGATALTVVAGITQHIPSMWIIMAAVLVFCGGVLSAYFSYQLILITSSSNKLRYLSTVVLRDLTAENRRGKRAVIAAGAVTQRFLDKVQVGVQLHNVSHFPISAFLHSAETEIEGISPPRTTYPKAATQILPGNQFWMTDELIPMDGMPCGKLEGRMDMLIKYGEPGNEKFELRFHGTVQVFMRQDGLIENIYTGWQNTQV